MIKDNNSLPDNLKTDDLVTLHSLFRRSFNAAHIENSNNGIVTWKKNKCNKLLSKNFKQFNYAKIWKRDE